MEYNQVTEADLIKIKPILDLGMKDRAEIQTLTTSTQILAKLLQAHDREKD